MSAVWLNIGYAVALAAVHVLCVALARLIEGRVTRKRRFLPWVTRGSSR